MNCLKILIVSRTPWNNANSFGNTFSNLFGGMLGVRIFNICCQSGSSDNSIVEQTWQMTDSTVLKSILGQKPGRYIPSVPVTPILPIPRKKLAPRRTTVAYIVREFIWKVGRWSNRGLRDFVKSIHPDVLYLPIYRSGYLCDVQQYVISVAKCPVVCHITDDVYVYRPSLTKTPLKALYYTWMRKKIRNLIEKAEYGEVFAQNMVDEYSALFRKDFYIIGKGIDINELEKNTVWTQDRCTSFVYTGNYGGERGLQLVNLAVAIAESFEKDKAELRIYSTTSPDPEIEKQLAATGVAKFCGALSPDQVKAVQRTADFLVHVEGFSNKSIAETRMSFSTKLIDYMMAQRPIIAIGPEMVNSIQILSNNNLAIVATNNNQLKTILTRIRQEKIDIGCIINNAVQYLKEQCNIVNIQSNMLKRLNNLFDEKNTSRY